MTATMKDLFGQALHTEKIDGEDYAGFIVAQTKEGVLFDTGERDVWLPKSKIHIEETARPFYRSRNQKTEMVTPVEITIPDWLAKDKELI